MVWKLGRLSRSPKDVPRITERIAQTRAGFRSIPENIDITPATLVILTGAPTKNFQNSCWTERLRRGERYSSRGRGGRQVYPFAPAGMR